MGNMHISHDPIIIAYTSYSNILNSADVYGHIFSHGVAITYFEPSGFTRILFVLRYTPNRAKTVKLIVFANGRVSINHTMGTNTSAFINTHMITNNAIRSHLNRRMELCTW